MSRLSSLKGFLKPALTAAGVGAGAAAVGGLLTWPRRERSHDELRQLVSDERMKQVMDADEDRQNEQAIQANLQTLASMAPDVYARVSSGMDLPPGAVVFGSQPRTDLLRELALAMSQGRIGAYQ